MTKLSSMTSERLQNMVAAGPLNSIGRKLTGRDDLTHQFWRYTATVFWLYRELFRILRSRLVFAVAINVVGVTLQGVALSLLVYYAHLMERGESFTIANISVDARNTTTFLAAIATIGLFMMLSAVLVFVGSKAVLKLAVDFATHKSQHTLALSGARPPFNQDPSESPYPSSIASRATSLVAMARGVRPLLGVSNPTVQFLYTIAVLLYIDSLLTLLMVVFVAPSLFLQYLVNYHAAQNEKLLSQARRQSHQTISKLLDRFALSPRIHNSQRLALNREYADPRIRDLLRRYSARVMARPRSALISDIIIAFTALVVMARLGLQALANEITWAEFVGYLVFARLFLMSLRGVLGVVTSFARHYPRLRKLYELFCDTSPPRKITESEIRLSPKGADPIGDRNQGRMKRGHPIAIVTPVPVSRYNFYAYIDALVGRRSTLNSDLRKSCACVSNALEQSPGGNLRELLGFSENASWNDVVQKISEIGYRDIEQINDLSKPLTKEEWIKLPVELRANILFSNAEQMGSEIVLVENDVLSATNQSFLDGWWNRQAKRFVAVRYDCAEDVGQYGEKLAIVLATDRATGLMNVEWCRSNCEEIATWLNIHHSDVDPFLSDDEEWVDDE